MSSPKFKLVAREIREQLIIALPLVGFMLLFEVMLIANTVVAGRVDSTTLAIIGVSNSIWALFFFVFQGIGSAINPLMATAHALDNNQLAKITHFNAFLMMIGVGVLTVFAGKFVPNIIPFFEIDPALSAPIVDTFNILVWTLPAYSILLSIRYFYEGISDTRPLMLLQLAASIIHLIVLWRAVENGLNIDDAHIAISKVTLTSIYIYCALSITWLLIDKNAKNWRIDMHHLQFDWAILKNLISIGAPIAFLVFAETGLFVGTNILAAKFQPMETAAHVLTMAHLTIIFMIPLGLSNAVSVRVARARALNDHRAVLLRGNIGIAIGCCVLLTSAMTLWFIPEHIASLYSIDQEVVDLAAKVMLLAALFQLFDAVQVTTVGALRGIQDTTLPSILAIFSYWGVGAPIMYYSAFKMSNGFFGLWHGLIAGLCCASLLLFCRWYWNPFHKNSR